MRTFGRLLIAVAVLGLGLGATAEAADLTVTIRDVRGTDGIVTVSVFDSEQTFLGDDTELASIDVPASPGEIPVVFTGLKPGTYAVAAFHDANTNGETDTNFLGIPTEGYGFSNGAKVFLGPPSFKDAAVKLETAAKTVLEMSY